VSLHLQAKAEATPTGWDSEFATSMHSAKAVPLCFAGGQRHRRSPDEGLGERAGKKVSEAPKWRTRGGRVFTPHWGFARQCPNVID
jgi:hypothetical protein